MSTPQTKITVCSNTRLNNRYEHSIYFESASEQLQYFNRCKIKEYNNYTYTRRSWTLKVEASMASAREWDYMFFKNFTNGKMYYYFITKVEYVNDSTVELSFELDVIQTYMFDWQLQPCFIERQHTTTDKPGDNLVEESIDTGDFTTLSSETITELNDLCILMMTTFYPSTGIFTEGSQIVSINSSLQDGIFSGLGIFAQPNEIAYASMLGDALKAFDDNGVADGVLSIWMYPKNLVQLKDGVDWSQSRAFMQVTKSNKISRYFYRPTKFGNYEPKNNKLLTYPYNFLYITNNSGGAATYKYERFQSPLAPGFEISGAISPEGVVRITPRNYDGEELNYEKGLTLGGFPSCAWNSDTYKIWLAQNQNQQATAGITAGLSIAGGLVGAIAMGATGNVLGAVGGLATMGGGIQQVASMVSANKDREIQPNEARGSHSASINVINNRQTFTVIKKQVTPEYAKIIDDYFTMYGYAIKKIATPNIHARTNFTYIKTVGCMVHGHIGHEDKIAIEQIFDKGITFWANGDVIGLYHLRNSTFDE